jgi:phosphosulfolactate phosphohydrolase-like enzyme
MIEFLRNRKAVGADNPIFTYSTNFPQQESEEEVVDADDANRMHIRVINKLEGVKVTQYNISPLAVMSKEFMPTEAASIFGSLQCNALMGAAEAAKYVFAGGIVNANAVIKHVKSLKPEKVTLVIVGDPEFDRIMPHNELCGEYYAKALMDKPINKKEFLAELRTTILPYIEGVSKSMLAQIEFCLELDRLNVVPQIHKETKKRVSLLHLKAAK